MQRTLFAHILNEEILLPNWLTHHRKLFTHGVIADVGSTDSSVAIIKTICPTWEVIRVPIHKIGHIDIHVMEELEAKYEGWKCVLNCSEYLVVADLEVYLHKWESMNPKKKGVLATGVILVDRPNQTNFEQFSNPELIRFKDFGYLEKGKAWDGSFKNGRYGISPTETYRNRLIHRNRTGEYRAGRHKTRLTVEIDPNIFVAWIGRGSPELYRHRCLSWAKPPSGITLFSPVYYQRMSSDQTALEFWKQEVPKSGCLWHSLPGYKAALDWMYSERSLPPPSVIKKEVIIS